MKKPYHLRTHKKRVESQHAAEGLTPQQIRARKNAIKVARHAAAKEARLELAKS